MSVYRQHSGGVESRLSNLEALDKVLNLHRYLKKRFYLTKIELDEMYKVQLNIHLNKLKILANRYSFGVRYFKSLFFAILYIVRRRELNWNYFFLCIVPDSFLKKLALINKKSA